MLDDDEKLDNDASWLDFLNISCSIYLGIVGLVLIWGSTDGKNEERGESCRLGVKVV